MQLGEPRGKAIGRSELGVTMDHVMDRRWIGGGLWSMFDLSSESCRFSIHSHSRLSKCLGMLGAWIT
jgi:hypothetical protein